MAVTFLYQHQRVVKRDEWGEWIETSLEDIAIANELATELFGYSLDELSFPGRELLRLIGEHVAAKAAEAGKPALEIEWTRRELREAIHWTEARLRLHLAELARMEYVQPRAGKWGKRFSYRLGIELAEIAGGNRFVPGIKDVETLRREAELAGIVINFAGSQGHFARASDHFVGTSQPSACEVESVKKPDQHKANGRHGPHFASSDGKRIYVMREHNGASVSVTKTGSDGRGTEVQP